MSEMEALQQHENIYPGPNCEVINLTICRLAGQESFPLPSLCYANFTNAVILEIRHLLLKQHLPWQHAVFWMKNIMYFNGELSDKDVRRSWNRLQETKTKLSKASKKEDLLKFSHTIYAMPQIKREEVMKNTKITCDEENAKEHQLHQEINILKEHNKSLLSINSQLRSDSNFLKTRIRTLKRPSVNKTCHIKQHQQVSDSKWTKINVQKRENRRNLQIQYLRETTKQLSHKIITLQKNQSRELAALKKQKIRTIVKLRGLHVAKDKQMQSLKERSSLLQKGLLEEKESMKIVKESFANKRAELDMALSIQEEETDVSFFNDGAYNSNLRQVIMQLSSKGVAVEHISTVISIVLKKLAGISVSKLPSESSCRRIIVEGGCISKMQVMEAAATSSNNTIAVDGTTDRQRHFLNHQLATPEAVYTVSLCETASSDTQTQLDTTLQIFKDYSVYLSHQQVNQEEIYSKLILSIKNIMSDQHIVNKCYKEKLEDVRSTLLQQTVDNWETIPEKDKEHTVRIHQWFCHLHVLIGLADASESALKTYEGIVTSQGDIKLGRDSLNEFRHWKKDGSCASRVIRSVCQLLGPGGNAVAGVPEDFNQFLDTRQKKNQLKQFEHTRFNILFKNAAAVYYHLSDIEEFLELCSSTLLSKAVKADTGVPCFRGEVRSLGIFFKFVTEPYNILLSEKKHILDLNPYFLKLAQYLNACHQEPRHFFKATLWDDYPPNHDGILKVLLEGSTEEEDNFSMEALSILATHALVTVKHLLKCQLPGGVHGSNDEIIRAESKSVPTSNIRCEQAFGTLKQLQRYKPNASTEHLEACIMWSHNGTMEWLESLPQEDREKKLLLARSNSPVYHSMLRQRRSAVKKGRVDRLKRKAEVALEGERKQVKKRQSLMDSVEEEGGRCRKPEDVDALIQRHTTKTAKLLAVKAQINLYKTVLKLPEMPKELFLFSRLGKQKSVEQLTCQLKEIIENHSRLTENQVPADEIPAQDKRLEEISKAKKIVLAKSDLGAGPLSKKIQSISIPNFIDKQFRHRWKLEGKKGHKFYVGHVLGTSNLAAKPSFSADDNEDDERNHGPLYDVKYNDDEEIYHIRLEKDWLAGDVDLD